MQHFAHDESPDWRTPRWQSVVLVCKQCRKRSSGPKNLKTRDVIDEVRSATKRQKLRPRVLTTSCLGLCPKRAIAVAVVSVGGEARITPVDSLKQLRQLGDLEAVPS